MQELIEVRGNFSACLREGGKLVAGSHRQGHNVFTVTGRNWLSKLVAWRTIQGSPPDDEPFTHRRVRWIGVGDGAQLEVTTVSSLASPVIYSATDYLAPLDNLGLEFPTSTSVKFSKEFGTGDISLSGPVSISEAGLFVDVNPATMGGYEDAAVSGELTTLDPSVGSNPPIAYKTFEPLPKTSTYSLDIMWEFRF